MTMQAESRALVFRILNEIVALADVNAVTGNAERVEYATCVRRLRNFLVTSEREGLDGDRWAAVMVLVTEVLCQDQALFRYVAGEVLLEQVTQGKVQVSVGVGQVSQALKES